jgi:hypothetical protein
MFPAQGASNPMPFQQKPSTLRPLPTRVTQRQYDRLMLHRTRDNLSIQEHVRRSLDIYLEQLDKRWEREVSLNSLVESGKLEPSTKASKGQKAPGLPQKQDLQSVSPKLVYR